MVFVHEGDCLSSTLFVITFVYFMNRFKGDWFEAYRYASILFNESLWSRVSGIDVSAHHDDYS